MKDDKFKYEIEEYIGVLKEGSSDWTKSVVRIAWHDNAPTIDVRNINMSTKRVGKGVSLSNEECDKLVDLLVENDYGSIDALKAAIKRKESIYSVKANEKSDDDDEPRYYTIGV